MSGVIFIFVFAFIGADFLTGTIAALAQGKWNSSLMRQGLIHKTGSMLCVAFGVLVEYANRVIDLGINVPICTAICTYICLMECGSIIENIGKINPEIIPQKLRKYFEKLRGDGNDGNSGTDA